MLSRIFKSLASLRLTVVCLALALALVFGGTIAQVHLGLYEVQARYFRSWLVLWDLPGSKMGIPIFPGGWLIGGVLLINLVASHITRFQFSCKKLGIWLAHLGLIILLSGQFLTEACQVESLMRVEVGETKTYSEDSRKLELVVIDTTNPDRDDVVSIPADNLAGSKEIRHPQLPFALRVKGYLPNALPTRGGGAQPGALKSSQGIGQQIQFAPTAVTASMESENSPVALIEIVGDKGSLGDWVVSPWLTKISSLGRLTEWLGSDASILATPQAFACNNHNYRIELRPTRYYKPYTLKLIEFRHDLYPGTDIPKNFSSRVHLEDPTMGESRDVLIYMNNPLRYRGDTYYQSSFEPGDRVSILQVVRNPASATPYLACVLITTGLLIQFMMHLFTFSKKNSAVAAVPVADAKLARPASNFDQKEKRL